MGVALLLSAPFARDHRLGLTLSPLATRRFTSFHVQPWHLPFMKPREVMLKFLLSFSLLMTSQVLMSSSHALTLRIPET
jgi:hypothetical protein